MTRPVILFLTFRLHAVPRIKLVPIVRIEEYRFFPYLDRILRNAPDTFRVIISGRSELRATLGAVSLREQRRPAILHNQPVTVSLVLRDNSYLLFVVMFNLS